MGFEWDERKRRANPAKHGIDFAELEPMFRGPISDKADRRRKYGEARLEEEIEAAAASDPDHPPTDEEFWRDARTVYPDSPRWELIPLHLDVDVLAWFRARQPRYQDEINAALRAYMEAHRDED